MIPDRIVLELKAIAAARYPHEAVFAYWSEDNWQELANVHRKPVGAFEVSREDDLFCLANPPRVLIHSHTTGAAHPSDFDTRSQLLCGYPWGIICLDGTTNPETGQHLVHSANGPEYFGTGSPIPPLLGRTYLWGVRDCYTLVQGFFAAQGITLQCVPRVSGGNCRFDEWIPKVGFKPIEPHQLEPGDVVAMQLSHAFIDHCAVFLGEGRYLEHVDGRNSEIKFHRPDVLERRNAQYFRLKDTNAKDRSSWSIDRPLPGCS